MFTNEANYGAFIQQLTIPLYNPINITYMNRYMYTYIYRYTYYTHTHIYVYIYIINAHMYIYIYMSV